MKMEKIIVKEQNINMVFEKNDENEIKLLHFSSLPFDKNNIISQDKSVFQNVELAVTGENIVGEKHGQKYSLTSPGSRLKFQDFLDNKNKFGRKIEIKMYDDLTKLEVSSHYQFYSNNSCVRCWTTVKNVGNEKQGLEYISSFKLAGVGKEGLNKPDDKLEIYIPHNSWQREVDWRKYSLEELGLPTVQKGEEIRGSKLINVSNTGNWSTKEHLPMGIIENTEVNHSLFWQIENNGSWYWELGDQNGYLYLNLGGPNEYYSHWWKELSIEEEFSTVPVVVGSVAGGIEEVVRELTKYRRIIRRKNTDNQELKVIFNDYMNCLFGNPTTEKEIPLIDKASEAGCEYYCVDCGWYADGYWWDEVGEWQPSKKRFPEGIKYITDYIKSKGMIPGLWLELEVMGINSSLVDEIPEDWFFHRHGKKVHDRSRYQLDFRNKEVRNFATEIIDRVVNEYGVGYIKMDYNIEPGIGTDLYSDSTGDGQLEHNRAYLSWLDSIFHKYPDLVIENCSSGGLRMDYSLLSRHSIQSTSDQEDYLKYATISVNAPTAVTPEQAAVWSYPLQDATKEDVIFNMVNAMMLRVHQSGHLSELSSDNFNLVKEGIGCYKRIRHIIKNSYAYWPLGLASYTDKWLCLGLKTDKEELLGVWRRESEESIIEIPLTHLKNQDINIELIYPQTHDTEFLWNSDSGILTIRMPERICARLFKIIR